MLMHLVLDCNGALAVQLKVRPHFQIRPVRFYNGSSSQPLTSDHGIWGWLVHEGGHRSRFVVCEARTGAYHHFLIQNSW